jgi:2,3-bisphosphoglycerate-independent phosphoglycerate mutase
VNKTKTSIAYILLDGVGDLPNHELNDLTPLEAAYTPALDALARNGRMGQVTTVKRDIAPQSDIAVFNMLGYDFRNQSYVGRGVIESIGCGIDFREGDLAMRGNFATLDEKREILDRRAGRNISSNEAKAICDSLTKNIKFEDKNVSVMIQPTVGHRVVARFRHNKLKLSEKVTNTDPAYDKVDGIGIAKSSSYQNSIVKSEPEDHTIEAKMSARLINDFTKQTVNILKNHPINQQRNRDKKKSISCILLRDSGNKFPNLQPIGDKYGINVASIVDMPVEIGISKVLNMDVLESGKVDEYKKKANILSENIANYNLIYAHIKGPDEFGHDGDPTGKKRNIEEIDKNFFANLLEEITDSKLAIVVSADHSTPCIKKSHSADPVPLLISGNNVSKDGSARFTEKYGSKGSIGHMNGKDVIRVAMMTISQQ